MDPCLGMYFTSHTFVLHHCLYHTLSGSTLWMTLRCDSCSVVRTRSGDRYLSNESLSSGYNTDFYPGAQGELEVYIGCRQDDLW